MTRSLSYAFVLVVLCLLVSPCLVSARFRGAGSVSPSSSASAPRSFTSNSIHDNNHDNKHHCPPPLFSTCAEGFHLVTFTVQEIFLNFSSEIRNFANQVVGTGQGICSDIPGTLSPSGSNLPLQSCVFTYDFTGKGSLVNTGLYDQSPNVASTSAITGIDGEFFQAQGTITLINNPDASASTDIFILCVVDQHKDKDKDKDNNDHDKCDEEEN